MADLTNNNTEKGVGELTSQATPSDSLEGNQGATRWSHRARYYDNILSKVTRSANLCTPDGQRERSPAKAHLAVPSNDTSQTRLEFEHPCAEF